MFLTKAIAKGLQLMAASAGAGGPADLGLEEHGKASDAAWDAVQAAIGWAGGLRPGRDVWLRLTPAEAAQLEALAERGWLDGGQGLGLGATAGRRCRTVLQKLTDARIAFDDDRLGRSAGVRQNLGRACQWCGHGEWDHYIAGQPSSCQLCGNRCWRFEAAELTASQG